MYLHHIPYCTNAAAHAHTDSHAHTHTQTHMHTRTGNGSSSLSHGFAAMSNERCSSFLMASNTRLLNNRSQCIHKHTARVIGAGRVVHREEAISGAQSAIMIPLSAH